MKQTRGSLYLLTGLILGIALGLAYAWLLQPVKASATHPSSLQSSIKDDYRALIATSFASNGDLVRARARLALLGNSDSYLDVINQATRMAQSGESGEVTALRLLGEALLRYPGTTSQPNSRRMP